MFGGTRGAAACLHEFSTYLVHSDGVLFVYQRRGGPRPVDVAVLVAEKTNDRRGTCKRAGIEGYHRGTIRSIS